jgi:hypothetical protein
VIQVSDIKIDKISCTFDVPLMHRAALISSMKATAGYKRHLPAYRWNVMIPLHPNFHQKPPKAAGSHLLLSAAPIDDGIRFGRIEFNPTKVSAQDVWDTLLVSFGIDPEWVLAGDVTRCDLCTDIGGVAVDELVYFYPKFSVGETRVSSGKTLYIGEKSSNRRIAIYDKRAQLIATNTTLPAAFKFNVPTEDVTRIEFRLKKLTLHLSALSKLSNPFGKLQIAAYLPSQAQDAITRLFVLASHAYGVNAILYADWLKQHSPSLKEALLSSAVNWWNPTTVWESFPKAVDALMPAVSASKVAA